MLKVFKNAGDFTRGFGVSLALHAIVGALVLLAASRGVNKADLIQLSFEIMKGPAGLSEGGLSAGAGKEKVPKGVKTASSKWAIEAAVGIKKTEVKEPDNPASRTETAPATPHEIKTPEAAGDFPSEVTSSLESKVKEGPITEVARGSISQQGGGNGTDANALSGGGEGTGGGSGRGGIVTGDGKDGGPDGPASGGTSVQKYMSGQFAYIRSLIMREISYPSTAKNKGLSGVVVVTFRVLKDGRAEDVRVLRSSGYGLLDGNAVQSVLKAQPFPPPPVSAELVIPISYKIN